MYDYGSKENIGERLGGIAFNNLFGLIDKVSKSQQPLKGLESTINMMKQNGIVNNITKNLDDPRVVMKKMPWLVESYSVDPATGR